MEAIEEIFLIKEINTLKINHNGNFKKIGVKEFVTKVDYSFLHKSVDHERF
jgi:hypothetical protein